MKKPTVSAAALAAGMMAIAANSEAFARGADFQYPTERTEIDPVASGSVAAEAVPEAGPAAAAEETGRVKMVFDVSRGQPGDGPAVFPARKESGEEPEAAEKAVETNSRKAAVLGGRYGDIIARHAAGNGVPATLAQAVVRVESNFRADARGQAGEVGLMQIKPATARMMGYTGSVKGLYDPETNIKYGMKYLGEAHRLGGGDTCGTILRYNAGHGARRMNRISAAYCAKVKRHLGAA